jgi:anti-sigma factor RsiW
MTCRELMELLIDYVQGELEPGLCEHISEHLTLCPPCETFVSTYRITIQLTRRLPASPMPPELAARLQEAMRRHEGHEGKKNI